MMRVADAAICTTEGIAYKRVGHDNTVASSSQCQLVVVVVWRRLYIHVRTYIHIAYITCTYLHVHTYITCVHAHACVSIWGHWSGNVVVCLCVCVVYASVDGWSYYNVVIQWTYNTHTPPQPLACTYVCMYVCMYVYYIRCQLATPAQHIILQQGSTVCRSLVVVTAAHIHVWLNMHFSHL